LINHNVLCYHYTIAPRSWSSTSKASAFASRSSQGAAFGSFLPRPICVIQVEENAHSVKSSHLQLCDRVSAVREVVLNSRQTPISNKFSEAPIDISILFAIELDLKIDYILCCMSVLCYPMPNIALHFLSYRYRHLSAIAIHSARQVVPSSTGRALLFAHVTTELLVPLQASFQNDTML